MEKTLISIGSGESGIANFDLDSLLRTRLLIQANSGGGKSFTIRRLVEQCFGKVQIIIIDPEGEFVSLREKYGFALLGKGGEIGGDVRHAPVYAEKLLELNASVICDLYEMAGPVRAQWVKAFLTGLLNAPKELWHPVLVVVDEAHKFCPERGKGEAESTEAMLDLATKGRKRGFCATFATQRLGKLNKDAAAELLNVLIGRTFLDVDRDRAAEILGIPRSGRAQFDETLRSLTPGQFYSLGPAISTKPELVRIGKVQTSHPESGIGHIAGKQPPTPEQITKLLPKLADLPKTAEEKARTEAELRAEIRSLKAQLAAKPKAGNDTAAIEKAVFAAVTQAERQHKRTTAQLETIVNKLKERLNYIAQKAAEAAGAPLPEITVQDVTRPVPVSRPSPMTLLPRRANGHAQSSNIPGGEKTVLCALAQYPEGMERDQISILTCYKRSTRDAYLQRLREKGFCEHRGDLTFATQEGVDALGADYEPLPTGDDLKNYWLARLPEGERKCLEVLLDNPGGISRESLDEPTGYKRSTRDAYLQRLTSRRLIESTGRGEVKPAEILFA